MFSISRDFAPPFSLIVPYFIIGISFYCIAVVATLFFDVAALTHLDMPLIGWVHLFLLGFVMMVIFGAMAQLIPVVLEVGHFGVEFFYLIWPLMLIGTLLMVFGFIAAPAVLPFGGTAVLTAMAIFALNVFLTLRKVERFTLVVKSVILSNLFLLLGVAVGLVMALSFGGMTGLDPLPLLGAHVYLIVGGYITLTIMGISLVLLPMFGLSHGFSSKPINRAVWTLSAGVMAVFVATLFGFEPLAYLGYLLTLLSLLLYIYQITVIYKTRARKEYDIWVKSMFFSFGSLAVSMMLGLFYLFGAGEPFLLACGWLLFLGFFGFVISGHMYKIVPFLVWFERFSPLVGKEKVPMLADMVPVKSANFEFVFTALGVVLGTFGLLLGSNELFKAGASFLTVGALFLMHDIMYMIRFKKW